MQPKSISKFLKLTVLKIFYLPKLGKLSPKDFSKFSGFFFQEIWKIVFQILFKISVSPFYKILFNLSQIFSEFQKLVSNFRNFSITLPKFSENLFKMFKNIFTYKTKNDLKSYWRFPTIFLNIFPQYFSKKNLLKIFLNFYRDFP